MEKVKSWKIRKHHLGPKLHDFVGASIAFYSCSDLCVCVRSLFFRGTTAIDPQICWGPKSSMKQRIHSAGGAVQTSVVACIFIRKANRSLRLDSCETDSKNSKRLILLFLFKRFWNCFPALRPNFGTLWSLSGFQIEIGSKNSNKKWISEDLFDQNRKKVGLLAWLEAWNVWMEKNRQKSQQMLWQKFVFVDMFWLWISISMSENSEYCFFNAWSKEAWSQSLVAFGKANVFLFLPYVPTAVLLAGDSFFFGQLDGFCSVRFEFSIWTFQHQPTPKPISCCNVAQNFWSPKMDLKMTPDFEPHLFVKHRLSHSAVWSWYTTTNITSALVQDLRQHIRGVVAEIPGDQTPLCNAHGQDAKLPVAPKIAILKNESAEMLAGNDWGWRSYYFALKSGPVRKLLWCNLADKSFIRRLLHY